MNQFLSSDQFTCKQNFKSLFLLTFLYIQKALNALRHRINKLMLFPRVNHMLVDNQINRLSVCLSVYLPIYLKSIQYQTNRTQANALFVLDMKRMCFSTDKILLAAEMSEWDSDSAKLSPNWTKQVLFFLDQFSRRAKMYGKAILKSYRFVKLFEANLIQFGAESDLRDWRCN